MRNKKWRIALIGCGRHMKKNIVPFLTRINTNRIVACIDQHEVQAVELGEFTGAQFCEKDIRNFDLTNIDAAITALPPEPSFHVANYLIQKGIPCFVEKPAGQSTAALEILCNEIKKYGTYAQVGFNFRYAEAVAKLYELTSDHRKEPNNVTIDFYSKHPSAPQWGCDSTMEAWIRHNGVHAFDMARWLNSTSVTSVKAHLISKDEDGFLISVLLQHENNSVSILRLGNLSSKFIIKVALHALDGSRFLMRSLESIRLDLDKGKPSDALLFNARNLDHGWARSGFGPELKQFIEHDTLIKAKGPNPPNLEDAFRGSQLCDRVLESLNRKSENLKNVELASA